MNNLLSNLKKLLKEAVSISLTFLCLGVIVQILIDDKILGWDPVGNIEEASSAFTGVIVFVLLYLLYNRK